jgi:FkbM family methyltransferase
MTHLREPTRAPTASDVERAWAWHRWGPRWLPGRIAAKIRSRALAKYSELGEYRLDTGRRMLLRLVDMIQCTIARNGEWEGQIHDAVARFVKPGDAVLDVGGHIGYSALRFADWVGPTGKVIAFEPLGENVAHIAKNLELNGLADRVRVVQAAVADRQGEAAFAVHSADNAGMGALDPHARTRTIQVPTVALDDWLDGHGVAKTALVKIDVEGAEALVLSGMQRGLRKDRYPAIFLEVHPTRLSAFGSSLEAVFEMLRASGYRLAPWNVEGRFEEGPFPADGLYLLATKGVA